MTWSELSEARINAVIGVSKAQHISYTPTMIVMQESSFEIAGGGFQSLHDSPDAQLLPRYYRDLFWPELRAGFTQVPPKTAQAGWNKFELTVRRMQVGLHSMSVRIRSILS